MKQGLSDSFRDLGRYGYQHLGINPGGAMDRMAAQTANFLVGNDRNDAVLEMHFPAATILLEEQAMIGLTGADFSATINEAPIQLNTPIIIEKGALLQCKQIKTGARCYLSVRDGFDIAKWLGSYSTNTTAKAGGYKGRLLLKGDLIGFRFQQDYATVLKGNDRIFLPWHIDVKDLYPPGNAIRVLAGNAFHLLEEPSKRRLQSSAFMISAKSNRMGFRMKGDPLKLQKEDQIISSGVTNGTIQLLPDGQMIILMADHQTTGGYPIVAHVISADLPGLAQLSPNEQISFQFIEPGEAEKLLFQQQQDLLQLQNACNFRLKEYLQKHELY